MIKLAKKTSFRIGLISDTHGTIPDIIVKAFAKVDLIIHAGDIGKELVIKYLNKIAPVAAVRGNVDRELWAFKHPEHQIIQADKTIIYVTHNLADLPDDWQDKYQCIIYGHTHKAISEKRHKVRFINPGSAGICPSPSAALLNINDNIIKVDHIPIH